MDSLMNPILRKHPAVILGNWLRHARMRRGIVKRLFAGSICLSPAKYAEVEFGIIHWIKRQQEAAIETVLELTEAQIAFLKNLLVEARKLPNLLFTDIFTTQQLRVVGARTTDNRELTDLEKQQLLLAVIAPLQ